MEIIRILVKYLRLFNSSSLCYIFFLFAGISSKNDGEAADSFLKDVLVLPKQQICKKRKPALTSKAQCLTNSGFLSELKEKKQENIEKEQAKEMRKVERERKKKEKERKAEEREALREQKKKQEPGGRRSQRKTASRQEPEHINYFRRCLFLNFHLKTEQHHSSSESEAECPKCGLVYGEDDSLWICCDECSMWFDLKCSGISAHSIPEHFVCDDCGCQYCSNNGFVLANKD